MFVREPLAGETVGIAETDSGHWIVRFTASGNPVTHVTGL